jgi:hypothetical protein
MPYLRVLRDELFHLVSKPIRLLPILFGVLSL